MYQAYLKRGVLRLRFQCDIWYSALLSVLRGVVQFTFNWRAEPTHWHATNPALLARYLLLRERYYAPYELISVQSD